MPDEANLFTRAGIWWLRASVDGVERRESLRTRDVRVARKLRDRRLEELRSPRATGRARKGWGEAVAAYIGHMTGQLSPATERRYGVSLKQCEPWLLPLAVDAIDGPAIAALIGARRAAGAKPATVRRDLTAISRVLEFAEANSWREGNPTLSKRRLLRERRDPIALPVPADIEAAIAAATPRFGALIRAALLTGARQAELVNARWRGFNPEARTLEIIVKGNRRRVLALSDGASAHISAQPRTIGCDLIFARDGGLAFKEAASDFSHLTRALAARARRDGSAFRRFRFHDLRHFFAVLALRDGMGIYRLSQHLGHSSVKTTEIYLAFLTPEEAEHAKAA